MILESSSPHSLSGYESSPHSLPGSGATSESILILLKNLSYHSDLGIKQNFKFKLMPK